ncbi:hypothetical protein [Halorubrum pallidum]|uniref:DUF4239 domain-containing protein n=1 Tax=Halorubrum pallidum TaxID=1526114 RepID=A0ABD5T7T6_9EURY
MTDDADAADRSGRAFDGDADESTENTMRDRAGENSLKLWLLLRANRLVVAGTLTLVVFAAFVLLAAAFSPSLAEKVAASDVIETMFSAMITAIVTGATLVVTIGQLVLTQENGPLGDQRERMDGAMDVRESVASLTGSPSPTDPAEFLDALLGAATDRSETLRASISASDGRDDAFLDDAGELARAIAGNADTARERLDGARFGTFDVVFAALDFNYGRKIHRIDRLEADHGDRLTEAERDVLGELRESLSLFGPAREHIKTLYFQWALIDLSRLILYAAVPALLVAGVMLAVVDAGTFPGSTLGVDHITVVVAGAFAVTLLPFVLFVSYLLRVLTLAKRTLAIEPLILRDGR